MPIAPPCQDTIKHMMCTHVDIPIKVQMKTCLPRGLLFQNWSQTVWQCLQVWIWDRVNHSLDRKGSCWYRQNQSPPPDYSWKHGWSLKHTLDRQTTKFSLLYLTDRQTDRQTDYFLCSPPFMLSIFIHCRFIMCSHILFYSVLLSIRTLYSSFKRKHPLNLHACSWLAVELQKWNVSRHKNTRKMCVCVGVCVSVHVC